MTTYNRQSNVAIGDLYTASMHNTLLDNLHAFWTNAVAGGMPYWSAANAVAALAKPAGLSIMMNNGTIPSWLAKGDNWSSLMVNGSGVFEWRKTAIKTATKTDTTGHSYNSATWRDMPNSSANIVLDVTSTVIVFGLIVNYTTSSTGFRNFQVRVNGVDVGPISAETYQTGEIVTTTVFGVATGVTAGTRAILIRERAEADHYVVSRLGWGAIAIPE